MVSNNERFRPSWSSSNYQFHGWFFSLPVSVCNSLTLLTPGEGVQGSGDGINEPPGACDRRWVAGSVPVLVPAPFPSRHTGDVPMPPARGAGVCRCGAGTRKSPTAGARAQEHQVSLLAPHPHHTASPTPNAPCSPSSPDVPPSHWDYRELLSTQDALNLRDKDEPNKKFLTCHAAF